MHKTKRIVYKAATYHIGPPFIIRHVLNSDRGPITKSRQEATTHVHCDFLTASIRHVYMSLPLGLHVYRCRFVLFCSQSGLGFLELLPKAATGSPAVRFPGPDLRKTPNAAGSGKKRGLDLTLFFFEWLSKKGCVRSDLVPVAGLLLRGGCIYFLGCARF